MFLGEHQHSLDAKGRVILPARFRDQLEGGAVMAKSLDGCLAVYPNAEFAQARRPPERRPQPRGGCERQAARTFFAGAVEIMPDKQGRVAIPPNLREYAGPRSRRDRGRQLRPHRDLGRRSGSASTTGPVRPRSSKARASTISHDRRKPHVTC